MKNLFLFLVFLSSSLMAQNTPTVHTKGAMNDMGANFDLKIWLDTLSNKSNLYAMGPYDKMKGEITVFDGKPFFASAFEEGKATISQSWDIRSPFFVYSNVKEWEAFDFNEPISGVQGIQEIVADIAKSKGYDTGEPFAFRIAGQFDSLTCHIVTPRNSEIEGYRPNVNSQNFTIPSVNGELLGFYSEKHQGVFTGSKSFVHVHFLKDDQTFMGHVDKIISENNSLKLYLPKRQSRVRTEMKVNDTDFSKGRLGNIQNIDLDDLVKFHGHLCDGLVVGQLAIQQAMEVLFPDGIIDRTNVRIVSKSSPCLTDAAIYTTGGRYQFNTYYVSDAMDGLFIIQRINSKKTVTVKLNKGIKPIEIDKLGAIAVKGELSSCDLDKLKGLEDDFTQKLLSTNPKVNFTVTELTDFEWKPVLKNNYIKTDILNKNISRCSQ
jgi:formylmethanofuran dehydrogenase subunit E